MSLPSSPVYKKEIRTETSKPRHVIGICALESKSRSKPMRNILDRLLASNSVASNPIHFELILFTDQMILNEPISQWPACDALIAFYSHGFPLDKAIQYQRLRGVFCVNDLVMQYVLQDRRLTQLILESIDVPTPKRIWLNSRNDSPPAISAELAEIVSRDFNVDISSAQHYRPPTSSSLSSQGIRVGRELMARPFIEKPASADDHNIWIYQADGRVCKLFRKVANKCSETFASEEVQWRGGASEESSFIYEEFLPVDSGEDVKVYTVGPNYAYAESRKSPFIDGIVRRNAQGKEIRTTTPLTEEEQEIARRVCMAFGQTVCGFDMIRSGGRSFVIDVNGWSFVKGSDVYYDKAAKILRDTFIQVARRKRRRRHSIVSGSCGDFSQALQSDLSVGQWKLKAYVGVFRHADRTPKQKLKVYTKHPKLLDFFLHHQGEHGGQREILLRSQVELTEFSDICQEITDHQLSTSDQYILSSMSTSASASTDYCTSTDSISEASSVASFKSLDVESANALNMCGLKQILQVLQKKIKVPGTKLQIRQPDAQVPSNLQIILKWGGEFTHAGRHQSKDAGENLRKDLTILNKRILEDVRVYASSERRVQATAQVFSKAFFPIAELPDNFITPAPELLDDHLVEKGLFDSVKKKIRNHFRQSVLVADILKALQKHRQVMNENFARLDEQPTKRWCCSESPHLFKERWDKHFTDISPENVSTEPLATDLSRISDLYDSIRYDAIHHRQFLVQMFVGFDESAQEFAQNLESLVELFDNLHRLFRLITPLEYGFTRGERLKISKQISGKLLEKVVHELKDSCEDGPLVRLMFTKETQMQALLNLVKYSGIPLSRPPLTNNALNNILPNPDEDSIASTPKTEMAAFTGFDQEEAISCSIDEGDLDYLSQICFEFYEKVSAPNDGTGECSRVYSLRIGVSSGAHDDHLFDLQMDAKHAVTVKGRTWITEYLDGKQVLEWFQALVKE